jgi:transposase-like protein
VPDHEHEYPSRWAAIMSISAKIGCTDQTLNEWVKNAEVDSGKRAGAPTDTAAKLEAREWENRKLRQANEILCKASAYFAQGGGCESREGVVGSARCTVQLEPQRIAACVGIGSERTRVIDGGGQGSDRFS